MGGVSGRRGEEEHKICKEVHPNHENVGFTFHRSAPHSAAAERNVKGRDLGVGERCLKADEAAV